MNGNMPRLDIADYLGLTIETVSRTLTSLEQQATIELPRANEISKVVPYVSAG